MNDLDPDDVKRQTAALAEHFERSGIGFLPKPNADNVRRLIGQFAAGRDDAGASPLPAETMSAATMPAATPPANRQTAPHQDSKIESPDSRRPAAQTASQNDPPSQNDAAGKSNPQSVRLPKIELAATADPYPGESLDAGNRERLLAEQADLVAHCEKCAVLAQCRTQTVYGEGSVTPRFVFFGEAPGADEDRLGRPFVGKAGQLLDKMILACTLKREDVYLLNSVKCRPPGNRNPEPDEINQCRDFFETQFEILRSEYIVCLGAVAAQSLLQTKATVGKLRGKLHAYHDSKVLVTYHPAYLLRNPKAKGAAWQDLQLMLADAGIER